MHRYDGVLMFYGDVKVCADLSIASLSQRDVTAFIDMRNVERLETIPHEKNTIRLHIKEYRTVTMRSIPENSKRAQHKIFLRDGTRWIVSISRTIEKTRSENIFLAQRRGMGRTRGLSFSYIYSRLTSVRCLLSSGCFRKGTWIGKVDRFI